MQKTSHSKRHFDCWNSPQPPEERDQFFITPLVAGGGAPYLPREELFEVHQRAAREVA